MCSVSTNHYFSDSGDSALQLREIEVKLLGEKYQLVTSSGTFSPEHLDVGTEVLLRQLENVKPEGKILDIGCGWGPIALAIAKLAPDTKVTAIDVNRKCLELTKQNAERMGVSNIEVLLPGDVPENQLFDEIWSNPPIRVGKKVLHEILTLWLNRLSPKGTARLVVQKNLGSDSLQKWLIANFPNFETTRIDSVKGFRILKVTRS